MPVMVQPRAGPYDRPEGWPRTAARLKAGNCGKGFACLFRVCAVLPHQAYADGFVFFCRQLPKSGLSGYAHHLWLVPDPDSQPWQVSGHVGTRTGMTGRPGSGDHVPKSRFLYVTYVKRSCLEQF